MLKNKLLPIKEIVNMELEKKNTNETIITDNTVDNKENVVVDNTNVTKEPKPINKVIFLIFAEYIGYVSDFVEYAEKICNGKEEVHDTIKKLIELDADYIFKKMKEEYTLEEIRGWYDEFYPLLIKEYETSLNEKIKEKELVTTNTNELPY
jgi:hypothetical protein